MKAALVISAALALVAAADPSPLLQRSADYDYEPPVAGSYDLPRIKPAPGGAVLDSAGERRELRDLTRGKITVLSFIYSRCGDARACPYATGVLNELHAISTVEPELRSGLRLVSMSFDPEHDTPDRMAAYENLTADRDPGAPWHFLTAPSAEALAPVLAGYGQAVDKNTDPTAPAGPLNHTLRVYLIDPAGQIRNIYSSGTLDLRLVLADLRTLALETPPESRP